MPRSSLNRTHCAVALCNKQFLGLENEIVEVIGTPALLLLI